MAWTGLHFMQCVLLPFIMNLSYLMWTCDCITLAKYPTELQNSIPLVALWFLYFEGMLEFYTYCMSQDGCRELFGDYAYAWIVYIMIPCYPAYYIFLLPLIVIAIFKHLGTPHGIWDRSFYSTSLSLHHLSLGDSGNVILFLFRVIYIGLPFAIFSLVYCSIVIFLSPLWLFIFGPFGLGHYGIAAHVSFLDLLGANEPVVDKVMKVYPWTLFINGWLRAFCGIIFSISYIYLVTPRWSAIILSIACICEFLVTFIPAIKLLFCSHFTICRKLEITM